ncbi:hypothetical protein ACHAQJ_001387 [Trichoderma viride]
MDHTANRALVASSSYSYRPPSPPLLNITVSQLPEQDNFSLTPSYSLVDSSQVSGDEFVLITGNRTQTAVNYASRWKYEWRREVQRILDFLYLGPTRVVRDHDFLQREAITMVVVVRDARNPMNFASVNTLFSVLRIPSLYIDIEPNNLVRSFNTMVQNINRHLITVNRSAFFRTEGFSTGFQQPVRGKVLVTCETGNDRSPPLVAAYIMSMYGQTMATAVKFVGTQRFCSAFDEESKRALLTWQEIIKASTTVAGHSQNPAALAAPMAQPARPKRGLDDMLDEAEEEARNSIGDGERFEGREPFAPFKELDES